jgi:hypothetical protein
MGIVTKDQFTEWLQSKIDGFDKRLVGDEPYDIGDLFMYYITEEEVPVPYVKDEEEYRLIFKCSDGLLQSEFIRGFEGVFQWLFQDFKADNNLYDCSPESLVESIERYKFVTSELIELSE